ncbi:hypothetical protein DFH08DRAFT_974684 [Mycena albidolilacea]|uniref:Uncharacterized protein n=1 Tax=Mycena albidolilacea TaxID=1033008 RepID=A0AAD6Z6S2_9AGAR|nr:hypothetical protein DFH08DRAFT_974684 [Mycena albidolilacea]
MTLKTALLKGIKKRPGTAPPPELAPVGVRNAMHMIYLNGGQGQLEYKVGFSASVVLREIILNFDVLELDTR